MTAVHKWLAMLLCSMFMFITANVSAGRLGLIDVPSDHWAYADVAQLYREGYIIPTLDNTFHGDLKATQYDIAYMVGMYLKKHGESPKMTFFTDIPASHPIMAVISYSSSVMPGYADGTFRGDEEITRFQLAVIMSKLLGEDSVGSSDFVDVPADHWAYGAVSNVATHGILPGYGDRTFRGNKGITRYEVAMYFAKFVRME